MRVTRLSLTDFRSYGELHLSFAAGVTTLVGPNGAGKTNIVEALAYLSTLSSHRVSTDAPLVRSGAPTAVIRARVEKSGRVLVIEATIAPGRSRGYRLNASTARASDIVGVLRTVVFSPEDLDLVKGDPSGRRRFLDEVCVALAPTLAGDLADYDRVLKQRTALLKSARGKSGELSTLDVWDDRLVGLGAKVVRARIDAIAHLAPYVDSAYRDIAAGGSCAIGYSAPWAGDVALGAATEADVAATMRTAIEQSRPREIERGVCLVGPHRDEMTIEIGALPARGYASHGESWSCALSLRLGTYDLLTSEVGPDSGEDGEPVLILDDVFAELDGPRRDALARRAAAAHQVIVTAAVDGDVPEGLAGDVYRIAEGVVTRADGST